LPGAEQANTRLAYERDALKMDKEEWLATKRVMEEQLATRWARIIELQEFGL
jgi:hypothetical protein